MLGTIPQKNRQT